jgi:hypothetical protein
MNIMVWYHIRAVREIHGKILFLLRSNHSC